jgi:hypothetical protein
MAMKKARGMAMEMEVTVLVVLRAEEWMDVSLSSCPLSFI